MTLHHNPRIITDGLIMHFDAANTKSYPLQSEGITETDHGISEWYCFESGTVTYSAIYPGTIIYSIDISGNLSIEVSETTEPTKGTFSITAGYRYFSNKAIHLLCGGEQHAISPISLKGQYFGSYSSRYGQSTYYAYCPSGSGTVYFYDNVTGGVTGTATTSSPISERELITFNTSNESTYSIFYSTVPIIMTAKEDTGDRRILPPAGTNVYRRMNEQERTVNNTTPTIISTYHVSDDIPVFTVEIADGAGGDSCQGMPLKFLSNTFSWGNVLSDYTIVAPYANTTVIVSYYSNDKWNIGEVHSLNGTLTSPDTAFRDGTNGFGVPGTNLAGNASNLGDDATLWKWESNNPIYVVINDNTDDEEILLGWMSDKTEGRIFKDLTYYNNNGVILDDLQFDTDNYGGLVFDGKDDHILIVDDNPLKTDSHTVSVWYKRTVKDSINADGIIGNWYWSSDIQLRRGWCIRYYANQDVVNCEYTLTNGSLYEHKAVSTDASSLTSYYEVVSVFNHLERKIEIYLNGEVKSSITGSEGFDSIAHDSPYNFYIGYNPVNNGYFAGNIANVKIYNRALTQDEIKQNFNAIKNRFL